MNYILFDQVREKLFPFTHTRPVADIRCGILTMRERWEKYLEDKTGTLTASYLQPLHHSTIMDDNIYINGGIAGNCSLVEAINKLQSGQKLVIGIIVVAARTSAMNTLADLHSTLTTLSSIEFDGHCFGLQNVWDIFSHNDRAIREDYKLLTNGRSSEPIPEYVTVTGKENLFIEEGAKIAAGVIINATGGPVYVGKDAEIMEGCMLRGPIALCDHSTLKMGTKVYSATTIGLGCKVGGEVSNVVFFANSNKGHDGFVGNAVIGEWCNLGADTNCSNLKNNYDEVKIWSEQENKLIRTGLTFCGLLMGDHSKCGINTMFNTGTVVGVSCNIYGGNFPEKFVPSFSWGGSEGIVTYDFTKAMDTANRMMARRSTKLSDAEMTMYKHLFEASSKVKS